MIATKWHAEPQGVKDIWFNMAAQAKAEHMRKYPDYQYKPRKSSEKKRRTKKKAAASAASAVVLEIEYPHTITKLDGSPSQDTSNVQGFERIQPIRPVQPIAPLSPSDLRAYPTSRTSTQTVQTFQVFADQGADNVQGVEVQAGNNNVELGAGIPGGQAIGAPIDLEAEAGNNNVQVNNGTSGSQAIGAPIDLEAENVEVGNSVPGGEAIGAAMDLDAEAGDNNAEVGDIFEGIVDLDAFDGQANDYLQNLLDGGADDIAQATHDYYYGAYQGDGGENFADDYLAIEDGEELAAYDEEYDRIAGIHTPRNSSKNSTNSSVVTSKQATFAHTTYTNYGTTIVTLSTKAGNRHQRQSTTFRQYHRVPIDTLSYFCFLFFLVMFLVKPSVLGPYGEIQRL